MLSKNEGVKAAVADKLPEQSVVDSQEPGSSAAKVHARLLSSKLLADAVHAVVDTLKEVLNPSLARKGAKLGGEEEESEEEETEDGEDEDNEDEEIIEDSRKGKKTRLTAPDDEDSGSEAEVDDAGWESGTVDGGEVEEGADWESDSGDEGGEIAVANSSDESDDDSDDESDDGDENPAAGDSGVDSDAPPPKKAKSSGKETGAKSALGGVSTFLPSLSVGYTRGDSDASDISDGEGGAADAPRKNRRGQRARRAYVHLLYVFLLVLCHPFPTVALASPCGAAPLPHVAYSSTMIAHRCPWLQHLGEEVRAEREPRQEPTTATSTAATSEVRQVAWRARRAWRRWQIQPERAASGPRNIDWPKPRTYPNARPGKLAIWQWPKARAQCIEWRWLWRQRQRPTGGEGETSAPVLGGEEKTEGEAEPRHRGRPGEEDHLFLAVRRQAGRGCTYCIVRTVATRFKN